jgi:folate-dependent phosphoribosylglycinamide formyltransferase PurN
VDAAAKREFLNMISTVHKPLRIVVLISGGGTTLRNLIEHVNAGVLDADIRLVIAGSADAKGLKFADDAGIDTAVIERRAFDSQDAFSEAIFDRCRGVAVDVVVMGGFLKRVTIPEDLIKYGVKLSGCTVHFADNQYDHGPVILQKAVAVLDGDTPETLAARVFQAECESYPEALQLIAEGRVTVDGRRVHVNKSV